MVIAPRARTTLAQNHHRVFRLGKGAPQACPGSSCFSTAPAGKRHTTDISWVHTGTGARTRRALGTQPHTGTMGPVSHPARARAAFLPRQRTRRAGRAAAPRGAGKMPVSRGMEMGLRVGPGTLGRHPLVTSSAAAGMPLAARACSGCVPAGGASSSLGEQAYRDPATASARL